LNETIVFSQTDGYGLLLCWYFKTGSRQLKPIEELMMKITTNAEKNFVCPMLADSSTTADCYSDCQHRSKPNAGSSVSFGLVVYCPEKYKFVVLKSLYKILIFLNCKSLNLLYSFICHANASNLLISNFIKK